VEDTQTWPYNPEIGAKDGFVQLIQVTQDTAGRCIPAEEYFRAETSLASSPRIQDCN
jgi:hypothetical protein